MEKYEQYLKTRGYDLSKIEIIRTTPKLKKIEGIEIFLNEDTNTIELSFYKRSYLLAIDIVIFEIADPALDIVDIKVNDVLLKFNTTDESIVIGISDLITEHNKIIITLKDAHTLNYEFGCVLYKVFKNKKENWHLDILLEEYGISND